MNLAFISSAEWGFLTGREGLSIISVAIDAPLDIINALTGKNWPAGRGFSKNSLFESLEEMKIYGISRVADT